MMVPSIIEQLYTKGTLASYLTDLKPKSLTDTPNKLNFDSLMPYFLPVTYAYRNLPFPYQQSRSNWKDSYCKLTVPLTESPS